MRAFVRARYGPPDVIELREVDEPTVGDDEVLVRVRAVSVNPAEWFAVTGTPTIARPSLGSRRKVVFFIASFQQEDFLLLRDLIEAGTVTPRIDRSFDVEGMRDAFAYLGEGHARAKVVVTLWSGA